MASDPLEFTLPSVLSHVWQTLKSPRDMAKRIMTIDLPTPVLWELVTAIVLVSVIMGQLGTLAIAPDLAQIDDYFLANPLVMAVLQLALVVFTVFATFFIGRIFGGKGQLRDSLLLLTWLQLVMMCLQVVQTVLLIVAPGLGQLATVFGLFLFLWLYTIFTAEMHGFKSVPAVFVMILVSAFGISFVLTLILTALGVSVTGAVHV
ncbi:MAG: YIP1 family protein [Mangrovicoccus sp.]